MISDEKCRYKSWSRLKKQMNALLCDSLKDKIDYFYTSYHQVHDVYGRASIRYLKKEVASFTWSEMYAQEYEVSQLYREGKIDLSDEQAVYGELEKGKWMSSCTLCNKDFIHSVTIYLNTDIASALRSDNYLLRIFAYMDRRTGRRTLLKLAAEIRELPEWVQQFFLIRCEADGVPPLPPKKEAPAPHH